MQTITVGELKSRFSSLLEKVKKGEEIVIGYGKKKEKVAVLIPYRHFKPQKPRKLGILKGKASCVITPQFSISDEELLTS